MLIRWLRIILFFVFTIVATTLLAFTVLEWLPGLATRIHLNGIRCYAMFDEYVPDRTLVFVPRQRARSYETDFSGDMSNPSFGANIRTVRYAASYTSEGFRTNSSARPYDVVLLAGDGGGTAFRSQIVQQLTVESNADEALRRIAQDVQLEYVDLLPEFQERGRQGAILYYPFDTHWNRPGRQAAAESVARTIGRLLSNSGQEA